MKTEEIKENDEIKENKEIEIENKSENIDEDKLIEENKKEVPKVEKFEIEKIIKKGIDKNGNPFYNIKWMNYPSSENTWEPLDNLSEAMDLVEKFELDLRKKYGRHLHTPSKVKFAKYYQNKIYVSVAWKRSKSIKENVPIPDTIVSYEQIRMKNPNILIDYFEKRMKFGNKTLDIMEDGTCKLK